MPKLDICGDGRCDSPGHCAKYGTYTVIDENTNKVLDFEVIQVTEVSSSNAMEAEGRNRVLQNLKKKGVKVRCLTTDRHTTITAEMRKKHPKIVHQYDVWHLSKWVMKKLSKKSKKKLFQELPIWIQSVSAHFWWSIATMDINCQPCFKQALMERCKAFKKMCSPQIVKERNQGQSLAEKWHCCSYGPGGGDI